MATTAANLHTLLSPRTPAEALLSHWLPVLPNHHHQPTVAAATGTNAAPDADKVKGTHVLSSRKRKHLETPPPACKRVTRILVRPSQLALSQLYGRLEEALRHSIQHSTCAVSHRNTMTLAVQCLLTH